MAKPYSQDLRDRVIGAVDSGISARAASRLFGISESTGIKWVARWRRPGSIGAKRMGGYKRSPLDSHVDLIVELITEQLDLTVEEIRSALRERGNENGRRTPPSGINIPTTLNPMCGGYSSDEICRIQMPLLCASCPPCNEVTCFGLLWFCHASNRCRRTHGCCGQGTKSNV